MFESRAAYYVIGILLTSSLGYYVGQSPVPQLKAEIITIEQNNTVLENQIVLLIVENQEFKNQLEELLENITAQNNELARAHGR